jgi:cell wall-associated NlpC family hydrolase
MRPLLGGLRGGLTLALLLVLVACTVAERRPERPMPPPPRPGLPSAAGSELAMHALGLVGTRYRRAGADPATGFDCSGFVLYVYRSALGLSLPRTTAGQAGSGRRVRRQADLVTGDLVFFDTGGRGISHVGLYVGEGRFVHAPNHGGRVRLDALADPYWQQRYRGARRVISP